MFEFEFRTLEGPLFWWAAHLSTNVSDEAVKSRTKSRANGNAVTRTRRAKFKQQNWRESFYLQTVTHCSTVQLWHTTVQHHWNRQWQRSTLLWRMVL